MKTKLTRGDIKQWIQNDEGLYNWWRGSRMSLNSFITANSHELVQCIRKVLDGDKPAHYLAYGR